MNGGDQLARGAKSAQFTVSEGISQSKWDAIWDESGEHFKNGEAPAGTPPELINPPAKKLKKVWSK